MTTMSECRIQPVTLVEAGSRLPANTIPQQETGIRLLLIRRMSRFLLHTLMQKPEELLLPCLYQFMKIVRSLAFSLRISLQMMHRRSQLHRLIKMTANTLSLWTVTERLWLIRTRNLLLRLMLQETKNLRIIRPQVFRMQLSAPQLLLKRLAMIMPDCSESTPVR